MKRLAPPTNTYRLFFLAQMESTFQFKSVWPCNCFSSAVLSLVPSLPTCVSALILMNPFMNRSTAALNGGIGGLPRGELLFTQASPCLSHPCRSKNQVPRLSASVAHSPRALGGVYKDNHPLSSLFLASPVVSTVVGAVALRQPEATGAGFPVREHRMVELEETPRVI